MCCAATRSTRRWVARRCTSCSCAQQAATKQAALIARQVVAQAAQTFARASGLAVKAKQSPSEACVAWLGALR